MVTPSVGIQGQQGQQAPGGKDRFEAMGTESFLKLMIAELQNQDPTSPMSNSELLQQVSQIREIQSNVKMSETLEAVTLSQNLASAANLIGKTVKGLDDSAAEVSGRVDRVSIVDGVPKLYVGQSAVGLKNISEILDAPT